MRSPLLLVALLLAVPAFAQEPTVQLDTRGTSGTITTNGGAVTLTNTGGMASLLIQTSGTFDNTWELQCAADTAGTAFDADDEVPVTLIASSPSAADSVSNDVEGLYTANIAGCTAVRVITTAHSSGTMTVSLQSITSGGGSGGGGGGAAFNGVLLDAAGGDPVTDTANDAIKVNVVAGAVGGSGGTSMADDAAFTVATTSITPIGGTYRSTRDSVDNNDGGAFAMNIRRALYITSDNVVSTANSTTANLAGAAAFTGTSEDVSDYALIQVSVFSSHASGTDGLSLQQSSNGTNWDITDTFTIAATTAKVISIQPAAQFYRLVYTNGATLTTSLRIQTVFKVSASKGSSQRPGDATSNENDFEQASVFLHGFNGTTWDRLRSVNTGMLQVAPTFAGTVASTGVGASGAQTQRVVTATDSTIGTVTSVTTLANTTQLTPGTAAANLGKAEDAVVGSGDVGVASLFQIQATPVAGAADNDYGHGKLDALGKQWMAGVYPEDIAHATADPVVAIGCVRRDTTPSSSSGTAADYSNVNCDANGRVYINATLYTEAGAAITPATDVTHDSAAGSTGPQAMLQATTDLDALTAVTDGDAVRAKADYLGRQITLVGCGRENRLRGYLANTDGASTALTGMGAQGANIIIEIYSFIVVNASATDVTVDIRDGTAGSVLTTLPAPATTDTLGGAVINLDVPITFTANTAVAMDTSAAATTVYVTAVGCSVR